MKMQFIRHATLLLWVNNLKILVDPLLGAKGAYSPVEGVSNTNANPLTELPVSPNALLDCDAVLVTHLHRDHFDSEAAQTIPKSTPILCQPQDEAQLLSYGFYKVYPISNSFCYEGINFHRTNGKHGHGVMALKMAPVSGFIVQPPSEPALYILGDTIWYNRIENTLCKFNPAYAVCNCGNAEFALGGPITMGKKDILELKNASPDTKLICVHMEAWNHCSLSRQELKDFIKVHALSDIIIPSEGETLELLK